MLQGTDGKPLTPETGNPAGGPLVSWAFIVGVDAYGVPHLIEHDDAYRVRALRRVTLDDIYGACSLLKDFEPVNPEGLTYGTAFLVICLPDGTVVASPDVFEPIAPFGYASEWNIRGGLASLQAQIIAQKSAEIVLAILSASAPKSSLVTA